ncbi:hypothetical protein GW777_05890 [Candidatus Peregrinibacteria bacterium]|nr:hypothetical protein [bacterium]NCQ55817.1 hypothetical protein [Candidatus Parcubacteria bacterium]NCS67884.1 hypothetical protein [Candidatus Peregrinibacteria bacterium]
MGKLETGIEAVALTELLKEALKDNQILGALKAKLESRPKVSDQEYGLSELQEDLTAQQIESAQTVFKALSPHSNRLNLAAFPSQKVDSYFYDFALAVQSLEQIVTKSGAINLEELKAHMFPKAEAEPTPKNAVVLSAVEVVSQRIINCVEDGTIRLDMVRQQVHGHEGLAHFPGLRLAEIVREVVGDEIEIIVDDHTLALNAIKAYVNDQTEIPKEILNFMISKVPGGRSIGGYSTDKIAHLYLTTQADKTAFLKEIRTLSDRDHSRNGKSPDALVAKTEAEHLSDTKNVLERKRAAGDMVIASADFCETLKRFLGKAYARQENLENRLRAFLRNNGKETLLDGFTFETRTAVDKLSESEIADGIQKLEVIITRINDEGVKEIGPSDIREFTELTFLIGKTARVQGSNFSDRLRNFLESQNKLGLIDDFKILSNEEDKKRVTDRIHLNTLAELIVNTPIQVVTDIPEAVIGHLERHYQHKAPTTKARALLFLKDQNRSDLAEKLEDLLN